MEWPLLDNLEVELRRRVIGRARRRTFARNEVVFHEGDPGEAIHVITSGHVAIRITTAMGERVTLTVLGPGEAFGELALLAPDSSRTATAVAVEGLDTFSIHRRDFEELRREDPRVERLLVDALAARVSRLSGHLIEALHEPVEVRVARRLLDLAETYRSANGQVSIPMTQEDLASLAGTTRPTVNRVLRELEDAGAISIGRGRVEVVDLGSLERQAR